MRIAIEGNTWPADRLRALVQATDGFTLATSRPAFTIQVGRTTDDRVHVDTPDGPFEQHLFRLLRAAVRRNGNLAGVGLLALDAEGGNQNPKVMSIALPDDFEDTQLEAITRALWIALCTVAQHGDTRPWWERRWPWLFALALLLASPAAGQTNRVTFGGVAQPVTLADNADRLLGAVSFIAPQHIICDSGCSSGGGGGGTVDQGTGALAADAWPFYVTFSGAAIDPRLVTVQNASITVNQGTAAGLAAGWPVIIGNANQQTATWDSSTALNTAVSAGTINNYSTLIITARTTTTITAGQMTFQCSDDGSNWFNVQAVRTDSATVDTVYSFVASTNQAWLLYTGAWARCRALVSQQITGTGAATITFTPSAASGTVMTVNQPAAGTTQPVSAASLPLPTGAATESTLASLNGKVATASALPGLTDPGTVVRVIPEERVSTGALDHLGAVVSLSVKGFQSWGGSIDAGTCTCTIVAESSNDDGATYVSALVFSDIQQVTQWVMSSPNASVTAEFLPTGKTTNAQLRVSAYTSGAATARLRAAAAQTATGVGALSSGIPSLPAPFFRTLIGGADGSGNAQGATVINSAPGGSEQALVTRNIPSGTQTISGAVTATVMDVATATNQTGGGQKTQIVDGSGNVASQTANAIDVNIKSGSIANTGFNVNNTVSATPADGDAGLPTRIVPEVRSSTGTLGALNARVSIAVTGMSSVGGRIDAGTCSCTFSFKISSDGGATYSTGAVIGPLGTQITSLTVNNPNAAGAFEFFPGAQITNVAVDVTSYTSGSTTGTLRASPGVSALALGLSNGLPGTSPPLYATQIAGTDGTSLRQLQMKNTANAGTEYAAIVQLSSLGNTVQAASTIADGADATLGAKADAKNTATDTTAVTAMSVLKEISAMEQAPASRAVTNAGTFAVQAAATIADGADSTQGAKADAKSTATDTTAISAMSVLKEISAMEQAPASRAVTNAGTFAVQATLQAGAAIAGKFGIDQTTPGTTNGVQVNAALPAGANVIGHVIADSGSTTAVTGNVATTAADASNVTLGAKADAKSTATDTTAVTAMSVLKEISAMEQAPASRAVTNAGTFAVQAAIADAADVTLGAKADAKSTATDTTSVTVMSVLKEISAMEQAPASQAVTNAGTFAVQAAPPTLTKGSQGSTGYSVQNLYDAGRSRVSFTADRVTPAASDTLVTFVKNVAGTATSAQTTYTVTNAKTFRVTSIYVGIANTSTVSANVRVALRENTGGTCTASSAAVAMLQVAAGNIAANEGADGSLAIPDGWEFPAADSVCISAIGVATTETLTVTVLGYEY